MPKVDLAKLVRESNIWATFKEMNVSNTPEEIEEFINKRIEEDIHNVEDYTLLVGAINHMAWELNRYSEFDLSELYSELYYKAWDKGLDTFKGDDFSYYYWTLD